MSGVLSTPRSSGLPLLGCWHAWSMMGRQHVIAVAAATLLATVFVLSLWIDKLDRPELAPVIAFDVVHSVFLFGVTMLAWVAAVYDTPTHGPVRTRRLAWAIVGSAALASVVTIPAMSALGIREMWTSLGKPLELPPLWLSVLGHIGVYATYSLLFVAVAEVLHRRRLTTAALQLTQRAHATIAREVLESRLATMQAQVEPQFLFDSLVDIETLYRKDASQGSANLDLLINYLRVALPRLREPGSTIEDEIELVHAYLGVVTSLHAGRPDLAVTLPDECRATRFYPMLLLPLLQRAVRNPSGAMPEFVKIGISRIEEHVVIVLRFGLPDRCDEDPELARVRERLAGLFGDSASLECSHIGAMTQMTMRVPAEEATEK